MNKQERTNRIVARGEQSNHSHVIVGDATIERNEKGEIIAHIGEEGAILKHILESDWMQGKETWTGEHLDVELPPNTSQKIIIQQEFDPFEKTIQYVRD